MRQEEASYRLGDFEEVFHPCSNIIYFWLGSHGSKKIIMVLGKQQTSALEILNFNNCFGTNSQGDVVEHDAVILCFLFVTDRSLSC